MKKRCSRCAKMKPLDAFKPDSRFSIGRRPECRKCAAPARRLEEQKYRSSDNGRRVRAEHNKRYFATVSGREICRESARRSRQKIKLSVLTHYSMGTPECKCCGDAHIEFLTIDHLNGNGRKHRDRVTGGQGGTDFYRWLKRAKYPKEFQVLCFNCNFAKHVLGACPHKHERGNK